MHRFCFIQNLKKNNVIRIDRYGIIKKKKNDKLQRISYKQPYWYNNWHRQ